MSFRRTRLRQATASGSEKALTTGLLGGQLLLDSGLLVDPGHCLQLGGHWSNSAKKASPSSFPLKRAPPPRSMVPMKDPAKANASSRKATVGVTGLPGNLFNQLCVPSGVNYSHEVIVAHFLCVYPFGHAWLRWRGA